MLWQPLSMQTIGRQRISRCSSSRGLLHCCGDCVVRRQLKAGYWHSRSTSGQAKAPALMSDFPFFANSHLLRRDQLTARWEDKIRKRAEGCLSVGTRSSIGAAEKTGVARSFLRLTTRDGFNFERLHRYEASLWRQTIQIILLLNSTSRCGEGSRARGPNSLRLGSLRSKCKRSLWPPFSF